MVDASNVFAKGVIMLETRVSYSPELRRQMVDLVRAGRDTGIATVRTAYPS